MSDNKVTLRYGALAELNVSGKPIKLRLEVSNDRLTGTIVPSDPLKLKDLINAIETGLGDLIPDDLAVSLKELFLLIYSPKNPGTTSTPKYLIKLELGTSINLSNLPLVGKSFPEQQSIGINDLKILYASEAFPTTGIPELPPILNKGLNVSANLKFGETPQTLALPITSPSQQTLPGSKPSSSTTPDNSNSISSDNAHWYKLQKNFGPVHFERVGVKYQDAEIWFLLDASLSASGLSLSLDGLAFGSPIKKFEPKFDLKGLGIDYQGGDALEIGGAFLREQVTRDGQTYDEYDGAAIIKVKAFTLSAIGSYAYVEGHPSLFIYAFLDYPIGGPAFFFVTGLAAGFGYNRALKVPAIEQVATFPLVAEAINSAPKDSGADKLINELEKLREYIPPESGQIFLAVGIKFTSFKIIDSFVLLTIAFGNRFELNILGLSTLLAPPEVGATPIAEVQLALKASFLPAEGFLGVIALLTSNSYIFSKACHLTGGFAFYTWFAPNEHEGDFVLTVGGYHPRFKVPAHYPQVPRLGLNWQVTDELQLKADAYFALTASALMAGGHLQATWNSGALSAWFNAGADCIISWKPYYYDISIYVDMGVSYTFHFFGTHHITIELGADLHIWGPEFSGTAHIHLWIISFTVRFGSSSSTPQPITWDEFKQSFLPADKDICSITVKDGLVRKVNPDDESDLGVINNKHFCLVTNSVIPTKNYQLGSTATSIEVKEANSEFGIGSMAITAKQLNSTHYITIQREGDDVQEDFAYVPILKKAPTGLWGESLTADLNGNQFIENALSGFEIKPKQQPKPGETHAIDRSELQFSTDLIENAYSWEILKSFQEEQGKDIRSTIIDNSVNQARGDLLKALNLDIGQIDLSAEIADHFLLSPKIGALATK